MAPATKYGGKIVECQPGTMAAAKIQADHAVNRQDERRGQAGEKQIRGLMPLPMRGGAAPAQRKNAVDDLFTPGLGAVADGGEIGNDPDVPKNQRDGEISADRKDDPYQRAAKLRPKFHGVGVGQQPEKDPWAAKMQQRKEAGTSNGKQGHGFGQSIDGRAPF